MGVGRGRRTSGCGWYRSDLSWKSSVEASWHEFWTRGEVGSASWRQLWESSSHLLTRTPMLMLSRASLAHPPEIWFPSQFAFQPHLLHHSTVSYRNKVNGLPLGQWEEPWEVAKPLLWIVKDKLCPWRAITGQKARNMHIGLSQIAGPSWALWELYALSLHFH